MMDRQRLFAQRRIQIPLYRHGIPEVEVVGRLNYPQASSPLATHAHKGTMEICFLAKGRQVYSVAERKYRLTGGDVFVTLPDEVHGTGSMPEEKSILYWVMIKLAGGKKGFLGLGKADSARLCSSLYGIKRRHFKGSAQLGRVLNDIIAAYHAKDLFLKTAYMRNKIVEFAIELLSCSQKKSRPAASTVIHGLTHHIDGHITEKMAVPTLAKVAGLSPSWLKARFKQETGVPLAEYVLRKKIDLAKELLKKGEKNVTQVAFDLDFSSSQYFATVFRRYVGKTPVAWARS